MANTDTAVATVPEGTEADAKPKTLNALEKVVEKNVERGAGMWRVAADALSEIRERKLWKKAKDGDGKPYSSFVVYAEARFGFKKTYAYDLVKASRKAPDAITEGSARESMKADPSPLQGHEAASRIDKAFTRFEDKTGDLRDRAIDETDFVKAYDKLMGELGKAVRAFVARFPAPIEHEPTEEATDANPEGVSPTREDAEGE